MIGILNFDERKEVKLSRIRKEPKLARVIDITARMANGAGIEGAEFVIVREKDWFFTLDSVKNELCRLKYDGMIYDGDEQLFSDWRKVQNGYIQHPISLEPCAPEDTSGFVEERAPIVCRSTEEIKEIAAQICAKANDEGWE